MRQIKLFILYGIFLVSIFATMGAFYSNEPVSGGDELDVLGLEPIYDADVLAEELEIEIRMTFATTGSTVHQAVITPDRPLLSQEVMADLTHAVDRR